jgi:hypothetical protein
MNYCREPSLEDILSDPIIKAVIDADGVNANELGAMLRRIANTRRLAAESASRGW